MSIEVDSQRFDGGGDTDFIHRRKADVGLSDDLARARRRSGAGAQERRCAYNGNDQSM